MTTAFFIAQNRTPLDPISSPAEVRQLLRPGKAAILRHRPLTLISKLPAGSETPSHEYRVKLDPGSKTTGIAVVRDDGKVVWAAELTHRGGAIASSLNSRRGIRRGRRGRKTRYRKPRFLNRTRSEGWLCPSLKSRVENIMTWVKRIIAFCPITAISLELVKFDTQEMQTPGIEGVMYQQGTLAGYGVREYLYEKFKRTCAYCGIAEFKGDKRVVIPGGWEVDHIHPKDLGGSDRVSNLALACHKCNQKKSNKPLEKFVKDTEKRKRILAQAKVPLKDAAAVNSTRWALFRLLKELGLPLECGSGGRTAFNRLSQKLPKSHWIDAACVGASTPILDIQGVTPIKIKATGHGSRKMQSNDAYGFPRGTPRLRVKRRHGFQTGDLAIAIVPSGKYAGRIVARVGAVKAAKSIVLAGTSVHPKYCRLLQKADGYEYA